MSKLQRQAMQSDIQLLENELERVKSDNRTLRDCLAEAVAAHKESGGAQDERWFQWARFILEM